MEAFAQLLIKKSAKKRKIEEKEYLEDAYDFSLQEAEMTKKQLV